MARDEGFFGRLFDFSFSEFVTTDLIKLLYGLAIAIAGLGALVFVGTSFAQSFMVGLFALIVSPPLFVIYVIMARVYLEMVIVLFRIAENTRETADALKR